MITLFEADQDKEFVSATDALMYITQQADGYVGVFEVTGAQYELLKRGFERLSYQNDERFYRLGIAFPTSAGFDAKIEVVKR